MMQGVDSFFIPGPVGQIEASLMEGKSGKCSKPIVAVLCHPHPLHDGTMHNKVVHTLSRLMRDLGMHAVRFNFRGVGASEGEHDNGVGEIDDFLAVCEWMHETYSDHQFVMGGFSFGSYVAAKGCEQWLAIGHDVRQLLLVAPPVHYPGYQQLREFQYPVCVVQGDKDDVVEPEAVYHWCKQQKTRPELIRFAEAGHFFHGGLIDVKKQLQNYLIQQHPGLFV